MTDLPSCIMCGKPTYEVSLNGRPGVKCGWCEAYGYLWAWKLNRLYAKMRANLQRTTGKVEKWMSTFARLP